MIIKWRDDGWRKRFALFPIVLTEGRTKTLVWLQWTWRRFNGFHTEISITDPRKKPRDVAD